MLQLAATQAIIYSHQLNIFCTINAGF